jgi:hypothetical protein
VALANGTIPANGSCTVTVSVTSSAAGNYVNTIAAGSVTSANAPASAAPAAATLAVNALAARRCPKTIVSGYLGPGSPATMTITLANANAFAILGAAFTDTYPAGLVNASPAGGTTTCAGGTVTAADGGGSVALTGGTIPANGSCTVTVLVTAPLSGAFTNTIPAGGVDVEQCAAVAGAGERVGDLRVHRADPRARRVGAGAPVVDAGGARLAKDPPGLTPRAGPHVAASQHCATGTFPSRTSAGLGFVAGVRLLRLWPQTEASSTIVCREAFMKRAFAWGMSAFLGIAALAGHQARAAIDETSGRGGAHRAGDQGVQPDDDRAGGTSQLVITITNISIFTYDIDTLSDTYPPGLFNQVVPMRSPTATAAS